MPTYRHLNSAKSIRAWLSARAKDFEEKRIDSAGLTACTSAARALLQAVAQGKTEDQLRRLQRKLDKIAALGTGQGGIAVEPSVKVPTGGERRKVIAEEGGGGDDSE